MARNAFAATLTSSAVAKSVTTSGTSRSSVAARSKTPLCAAYSMPLAQSVLHADHDPVRAAARPRPRSPPAGTPGSRPPRPASAGSVCLATSCSTHSAVPTGTVDLPTISALRVQVPGQVGDRRLDVGQVGAHAVAALRRAHADEVHVAEVGDLLVRGGEAQPAGGQVRAQQLVQAGLVERHLAAGQLGDLRPRRRRSRAPRSRARRSRSRTSRRGSRCRGTSAAAAPRRTAAVTSGNAVADCWVGYGIVTPVTPLTSRLGGVHRLTISREPCEDSVRTLRVSNMAAGAESGGHTR